jgi:hypothetical protein
MTRIPRLFIVPLTFALLVDPSAAHALGTVRPAVAPRTAASLLLRNAALASRPFFSGTPARGAIQRFWVRAKAVVHGLWRDFGSGDASRQPVLDRRGSAPPAFFMATGLAGLVVIGASAHATIQGPPGPHQPVMMAGFGFVAVAFGWAGFTFLVSWRRQRAQAQRLGFVRLLNGLRGLAERPLTNTRRLEPFLAALTRQAAALRSVDEGMLEALLRWLFEAIGRTDGWFRGSFAELRQALLLRDGSLRSLARIFTDSDATPSMRFGAIHALTEAAHLQPLAVEPGTVRRLADRLVTIPESPSHDFRPLVAGLLGRMRLDDPALREYVSVRLREARAAMETRGRDPQSLEETLETVTRQANGRTRSPAFHALWRRLRHAVAARFMALALGILFHTLLAGDTAQPPAIRRRVAEAAA